MTFPNTGNLVIFRGVSLVATKQYAYKERNIKHIYKEIKAPEAFINAAVLRIWDKEEKRFIYMRPFRSPKGARWEEFDVERLGKLLILICPV